MISNTDYIKHSLELNLFFLRIAKEHAIFAAASFPPRDANLSVQNIALKNNLESLLARTMELTGGVVSPEVLASGELVTELTLPAEIQTQYLAGIPIDTNITKRELALRPMVQPRANANLFDDVTALNRDILNLMNTAIIFKENFLNSVLKCMAFSYIYPLMLDHVIREAKYYVMILNRLIRRDPGDNINDIIEQEIMWNRMMDEHTKFIRGYLDPSEEDLIEKVDLFAMSFDDLYIKTKALKEKSQMADDVTNESFKLVRSLRDFKAETTEGIICCKIRSLIIPLLSDHVTREANHYLRLLRTFNFI